uniref:Uncharacterized protein n=1 Tax=Rhizophora mucronata TaxID=61149 RepID=A0A2P2P7Z0_RHIMU
MWHKCFYGWVIYSLLFLPTNECSLVIYSENPPFNLLFHLIFGPRVFIWMLLSFS